MNEFLGHKKALVVVAHPDDEIIGCGGTISKIISLGREVHVVILGGTTTSRHKEQIDENPKEKDVFMVETYKASEVLGISSLLHTDFDDNRFDTMALLDIIKVIERAKDKFSPDLVITHDYSDLNIDHRITHQAVLTAFRPEPEYNDICIMTFETLSSTEWQDQVMYSFIPNCYVDIAKHFSKKIDAIKCYSSELRKYPHPRSLEGIEYLARKRGMEVGLEYAEAFRIVRKVI